MLERRNKKENLEGNREHLLLSTIEQLEICVAMAEVGGPVLG